MTIQMLAAWNGFEEDQVVSTLSASEEARLIAAKLARDYVVGMDGMSRQAVVGTPAEAAAFQSLVSGAGIRTPKSPMIVAGGADLQLADMPFLAGSGATVTRVIGPNGQPAIKVVTGVGLDCELRIPGAIGAQFYGDAYICADGGRQTGLDYVVFYASQGDASYANGVNQIVQFGVASPLNSAFEQGGAVTYQYPKNRHSNFGNPTYPFNVGDCKIKIVPVAGQSATAYVYAVAIAPPAPKSRICAVGDDGYDSQFKLGVPAFQSRGIKTTLAVIGSVQGTGGSYSKLSQYRQFVDAGNACVTHGPWPIAAQNSNVVDWYAGSADPVGDAVADAITARKWLADNGLLVPGAERCYVWPQGKFQATTQDKRYLDAFIAAGFTTGRCTVNFIGSAQPSGLNFDATSKYGHMALPIIGHTFQGNGSFAGEDANIAAIIAAIDAVIASRLDCVFMYHRVVPSNTPIGSMGGLGSINIRQSDLELIAAAIKTRIDAGTLEAVTMPELAGVSQMQAF